MVWFACFGMIRKLRDWRVHMKVIINLFLAEQDSTNSKYAKNHQKSLKIQNKQI